MAVKSNIPSCLDWNIALNCHLLDWIKSFLTGRIQFVKISGMCSPTCAVISSVPQGRVLGPVLFIAYVNDIVDCIVQGITVKLFADDTKLYSAFDALVTPDCLQSCLHGRF